MQDTAALFPETYETSRDRFHQDLAVVQKLWPDAKINQHKLPGEEDLTIDWILSDALEENKKILIFTTGEHGVECYVGSAILQRFIDKYLNKLDPNTTGLLLVLAINPWGMKYHRRVNASNVDLNRTFLYDGNFDPGFNPEYSSVNALLNPEKILNSYSRSNISFYAQVARHLVGKGYPCLLYTSDAADDLYTV